MNDKKPNNPIDVSVIIVNWNTCEITCDCLQSVYEQTADSSFEVILVDNASSDDSVECIKNEFPEVHLIENKENRGFAAANNQGMEIAEGRYALLLNSDTIVLDHAIEKTVAFADNHNQAGVIGCRVLNKDMSLQPTCFMYPSALNMFLSSTYLYKIFPKNKFFGRESMTWWDRKDVREVEVVTGCFMLVRKEAIDQVGMMDEGFFMYWEETDWCYRMKKAGWETLFTPDAEIIHLGGESSKQVKPKMVNHWRKSMQYFFKKHYNPVQRLTGSFFINLFFLTRVPFWLLRSKLANK